MNRQTTTSHSYMKKSSLRVDCDLHAALVTGSNVPGAHNNDNRIQQAILPGTFGSPGR